jgi:hypothetical protein
MQAEARSAHAICCSVAIAAAAALLPPAANGQTVRSSYTGLDLPKCRHARGKTEEDYGNWRCKGFAGIPVYVAAGDQRADVSFGSRAKDELAAYQTLAAFNSQGSRIEWRLASDRPEKRKPFATIIRWSTTVSSGDEPVHGQVFVVTRLGPGAVCHVGYVDALANSNGEELARKIADEHAMQFRCGADKPIVHGKKGPGFSGAYAK